MDYRDFINLVLNGCKKMSINKAQVGIDTLQIMVDELADEGKEINQNNVNAWLVRNV